MTPEVQAYIDAKFHTNYLNQWAMIVLLMSLVAVFALMTWHKLKILRAVEANTRELRDGKYEQLATKYLVTTSGEAISREIQEVPHKVAEIAATVAQKLVESPPSPSAVDGELPRPPLP